MIPREDRADEGKVDWTTIAGKKLGQFLLAIFQRRTALTGPHEGVQGKAANPFRMAFCEQRGAQRAGRYAINQER